MKTYYIYVLELKADKKTLFYYIGKTYQLTTRLNNHIHQNKYSAKVLKKMIDKMSEKESSTRSIIIKEIYKIPDTINEYKNINSITSKIENIFVTTRVQNANDNEKPLYRGGHLKELELTGIKDAVPSKFSKSEYKELLEKYSPDKLENLQLYELPQEYRTYDATKKDQDLFKEFKNFIDRKTSQ